MKRLLPLLPVCLLAASAAGTSVPVPVTSSRYDYGIFSPGTTVVGRVAALLAGPSIGAVTTACVPRGTFLDITGPPVNADGEGSDPILYPVSSPSTGTGWIQGTDLAMAFIRIGAADNLLILLEDGGAAGEPRFGGSAVVLDEQGALLDSIPIQLPAVFDEDPGTRTWRYCVDLMPAVADGLGGVTDAVKLALRYEACGYLNSDQLIVWDGERLVPGPAADFVSEAGLFHFEETMILPSDPGGAPNSVIITSTLGEWDDARGGYVTTEEDSRTFSWSGTGFVEE